MNLTGRVVEFWVSDPKKNNGAESAPAVVTRDWNPELPIGDPGKYINAKILKDDDNNEWVTSVYPKSDLYPNHSYTMYGECCNTNKSLQNTTADGASKNVKDIVFWGNGDLFKLIAKAHSKTEGWMKSTKAMEVEGIGVVLQVTTQQGNHVAEALQLIPGAVIIEHVVEGQVVSREVKRQENF